MRRKDRQQNVFTIEHVHEHFKMRQAQESEIFHFFLFFFSMVGMAIIFILEIIANPDMLLALWWIPVFGGLGTWLDRYLWKKECERIMNIDKRLKEEQ